MPIKGVVIIAAAGNENRNAASYPARYPHVMGALDAAGEKAPILTWRWVDISALVAVQQVKFARNH